MKCDICGKVIENSVNYCTFQRYKVKANGMWNGQWEDAIVCGNCISKVYGKIFRKGNNKLEEIKNE